MGIEFQTIERNQLIAPTNDIVRVQIAVALADVARTLASAQLLQRVMQIVMCPVDENSQLDAALSGALAVSNLRTPASRNFIVV